MAAKKKAARKKPDKQKLKDDAKKSREKVDDDTPPEVKNAIGDYDDVNDQIEALAQAVADPFADETEITLFNTFPFFTESHVAPPLLAGAVPDNAGSASRYYVIEESVDPNPNPPPADVTVRDIVPGKTLAEILPGTWATDTWLFSCKFNGHDARISLEDDRIAYVMNCRCDRGGSIYECIVGVGYLGEVVTRQWLKAE